MAENLSFRKHFHELANKLQGIAVNSRGFAYIYGSDLGMINENTGKELVKVLNNVEVYCKRTEDCVEVLSRQLAKTPVSKDWVITEREIKREVGEMCELTRIVKEIADTLLNADYKNAILSAAKELNKFQEKCEVVTRLLEDFKPKIVALGIYDDICG